MGQRLQKTVKDKYVVLVHNNTYGMWWRVLTYYDTISIFLANAREFETKEEAIQKAEWFKKRRPQYFVRVVTTHTFHHPKMIILLDEKRKYGRYDVTNRRLLNQTIQYRLNKKQNFQIKTV